MRYWAYFAGKLVAVAALSQGIYLTIWHSWPAQREFGQMYPPRFAVDLWWTAALGLWFLLTTGLLYLAVWDQRYRCRVCLRRMRMPIETGSWSRMLQFGRPEIEYICVYGHGRLNVSEVQISGSEQPEWTPQGNDIWTELAAAGQPKEPDGPRFPTE